MRNWSHGLQALDFLDSAMHGEPKLYQTPQHQYLDILFHVSTRRPGYVRASLLWSSTIL
jgi:hypothetical protein